MRLTTETVVEKYKQNMFAAAFSVCSCREDAEDAVQDAFIKYHTSVKDFESAEHIKSWLIRNTRLRFPLNQTKKATCFTL